MSSNNETTPATGANVNQEGGDNNNPVDSSQQQTTRPKRPVKNRDGNNDIKSFKGETGKMNGHVFQTHSERKDKSQFEDTMEALRIYASSVYKSDIESMNVLFTELKTPVVIKPEDPQETVMTDAEGNETRFVS